MAGSELLVFSVLFLLVSYLVCSQWPSLTQLNGRWPPTAKKIREKWQEEVCLQTSSHIWHTWGLVFLWRPSVSNAHRRTAWGFGHLPCERATTENGCSCGGPPAGRRRVRHGRPRCDFRESMVTPCHTPMQMLQWSLIPRSGGRCLKLVLLINSN
jgi:hypothetical protein